MEKPYNIWWGPPRKFSSHFEERKISWLELFYDLVYVIVISKATHYLATHHDGFGLLDYAYLFSMIYWGWYNGSQYHDLHGSPGIRTRFMILWQMLAVGALAVTLDSPAELMIPRATGSILFLQLFITYLWWSVGIYDKHHRKLNVPYTVCFLISFALLILTLFIPQPYKRMVFWTTLVLNYFPFFFTAFRLWGREDAFSLSPSMSERLGLFTIIVFGEAILGVINSIEPMTEMSAGLWFCFGLGILTVFALWWIFFSLIADRNCKPGILQGFTVGVIYIPALAALGMLGVSFPALLNSHLHTSSDGLQTLQVIFGISITLFLWSTVAISSFLVYPPDYNQRKLSVQLLLLLAGAINLLLIPLFPLLSAIPYLICVFLILLFIIIVITRSWFRLELARLAQAHAEPE